MNTACKKKIKPRIIQRPNVDVAYDVDSDSICSSDGRYQLKHLRREMGCDFSEFIWREHRLTFWTEWVSSDEGGVREVYLNGIDTPKKMPNFLSLEELREIIVMIAACLACPYYVAKDISKDWKRVNVSLPLENIRSLLDTQSASDEVLVTVNGTLS